MSSTPLVGSNATYQSGADTVVDFLNGSTLTLQNVNLASLGSGWITTL